LATDLTILGGGSSSWESCINFTKPLLRKLMAYRFGTRAENKTSCRLSKWAKSRMQSRLPPPPSDIVESQQRT
jgi:hypothetical protein